MGYCVSIAQFCLGLLRLSCFLSCQVMDPITSEATQSPSSSQGRQTFKIFPLKGGNRGQGLHHRIGVKRQGECEYRSAWPRTQRDLLRVNEARLEALLAEQVQAKGQPAQEVKMRELKKEIDKQLEKRAAAANRLMHAIDIADKKRLLTSRRVRDAVELGDPDVILEVILAHLQAISGVETDGDKASFLAEGTQTLSTSPRMKGFRSTFALSGTGPRLAACFWADSLARITRKIGIFVTDGRVPSRLFLVTKRAAVAVRTTHKLLRSAAVHRRGSVME